MCELTPTKSGLFRFFSMERSKIRKPFVAGSFYPSDPKELKEQISSFIDKTAVKTNALACVLPHAGYIYSGRVAAQTVSRILVKERVILLGPNHAGQGALVSMMAQGAWRTPLGDIQIDEKMAGALLEGSQYLEDDPSAHASEHSLEVELPILQYFRSDFKIVPIALMTDDLKLLKELGREIAAVAKTPEFKETVLIVASSDMTHYEPQSSAEKKDKEAIDAILALDEDRLVEKIKKFDITMCGASPVVVALTIGKALGARHATLVNYQTSADAGADKESVVGYAGVIID